MYKDLGSISALRKVFGKKEAPFCCMQGWCRVRKKYLGGNQQTSSWGTISSVYSWKLRFFGKECFRDDRSEKLVGIIIKRLRASSCLHSLKDSMYRTIVILSILKSFQSFSMLSFCFPFVLMLYSLLWIHMDIIQLMRRIYILIQLSFSQTRSSCALRYI
jgi:hypothetical protein